QVRKSARNLSGVAATALQVLAETRSGPSPRPSPAGRGRIVRRVFANPERLDSSQRGMRHPLSLRERARVRGKETPPSKSAGTILPAQLDQLPESNLAITSRSRPVESA